MPIMKSYLERVVKAMLIMYTDKAKPIGATSQRKDGVYRKVSPTEWVKVPDEKGKEEPEPEPSKKPTVKGLEDRYEKAGIKVDLYETKHNTIELSRVEVPKDMRNQGIGTRFMNELTDIADSEGKMITLTPTTDFVGTKSKLIEFYKRFGFVENKGKNKDLSISDTMYRLPEKEEEQPK